MPLKFHCPKCNRRFVEWGAEKLDFKCPECEDQTLVRLGSPEDRPSRRPSLKRAPRKPVVEVPVEKPEPEALEPEALEPEAPEAEAEEGFEEEEVVEEEPEKKPLLVTDEDEVPFVGGEPELAIEETEEEEEAEVEIHDDIEFGESAEIEEEPTGEAEEPEEDWS
jgi:phage FluMu protein Com